jgi:hypothetical protein
MLTLYSRKSGCGRAIRIADLADSSAERLCCSAFSVVLYGSKWAIEARADTTRARYEARLDNSGTPIDSEIREVNQSGGGSLSFVSIRGRALYRLPCH